MWCLAVAFLLAGALPAGAAADVPLGPPINVPVDGSKAYSPPLTAGVTYRVVATGTYTKTNVSTGQRLWFDAAYCFDEQPARVGGCTRLGPIRTQRFIVRFEGDPSYPTFDALNPATPLPYDDISHRYEDTFTATRSGRLEAYEFDGGSGIYTQQGNITLELYGPAGAAPPTGPGGSPTGTAAPQGGVKVLPTAKWGKPGPPTPLGPGDEAIAPGPNIAAGQTQASVAVSGDRAAETAIFVGTPTSRRPAELPKLTKGDCVRAAAEIAKSDQGHALDLFNFDGDLSLMHYQEERKATSEAMRQQNADDAVLATIFFLILCLDYVNELDKQAKPPALRPAVGAARLSCGVRTASLSVRVDRAAKRISYRSRRASRRGPARGLRVSCRRARDGAVTMRVRTRSRRTKLRKVLGKRLVVGLYRPRAATGTANVRTTFKRR